MPHRRGGGRRRCHVYSAGRATRSGQTGAGVVLTVCAARAGPTMGSRSVKPLSAPPGSRAGVKPAPFVSIRALVGRVRRSQRQSKPERGALALRALDTHRTSQGTPSYARSSAGRFRTAFALPSQGFIPASSDRLTSLSAWLHASGARSIGLYFCWEGYIPNTDITATLPERLVKLSREAFAGAIMPPPTMCWPDLCTARKTRTTPTSS
jgi:hypothetical protein